MKLRKVIFLVSTLLICFAIALASQGVVYASTGSHSIPVVKGKVSPRDALSVGCESYNCFGQDPVTMGCSATNSQYYAIHDSSNRLLAHGYNYYSVDCNANWGTMTPDSGTNLTMSISTTDSQNNYELDCEPGNESYKVSANQSVLPQCLWKGGYYTGTATFWGNLVDGTHGSILTVSAKSPDGRYYSAQATQ